MKDANMTLMGSRLNVRGDSKNYIEIIELHLANIQKLKGIDAQFDRPLPPHNGTPISKDYIGAFIMLSPDISKELFSLAARYQASECHR